MRRALAAAILLAGATACSAPREPPASPPAAAAPATGASPDAVRAVLQRSVAAFNRHDPRALADTFAPDVIVATPGPGGLEEERGRELIVQGHTGLFTAYPDIRMTSRRIAVRGAEYVHEWVSVGTHRRSGKTVGIEAATIGEVGRDGLVRVDHTYFDAITMDIQKGDRPGKARPLPDLAGEPSFLLAARSSDEDRRAGMARAFYAALEAPPGSRDLTLLAEGAVLSDVSAPSDLDGKPAIDRELSLLAGRHTPRRVLAAGPLCAVEVTFSGTHQPSGRLVELHRLDVLELSGGAITRVRVYASRLELMGQLGQL